MPPHEGPTAFYDLIGWDTGRFAFIGGAQPEHASISEDLQSLLLEGMRRLDEYRAWLARLPSLDTKFSPCYDAEQYAQTQLDYRQWRMLQWVDGARAIQELIELSGTNPVEAARSLVMLSEMGLITTVADTRFLADIVVRRLAPEHRVHLSKQPLSPVAAHILRLVDGERTLRDIHEHLRCGQHDLIEQIRRLVALRWLEVSQGINVFYRHIA